MPSGSALMLVTILSPSLIVADDSSCTSSVPSERMSNDLSFVFGVPSLFPAKRLVLLNLLRLGPNDSRQHDLAILQGDHSEQHLQQSVTAGQNVDLVEELSIVGKAKTEHFQFLQR